MNKIKKIKDKIFNKEDTYSYKGWIISDSFIKRSVAIFGYLLVAQFMLSILAWLFMMSVSIIGALIY